MFEALAGGGLVAVAQCEQEFACLILDLGAECEAQGIGERCDPRHDRDRVHRGGQEPVSGLLDQALVQFEVGVGSGPQVTGVEGGPQLVRFLFERGE
nr:hypothetical protein [Brachybacterium timonense]